MTSGTRRNTLHSSPAHSLCSDTDPAPVQGEPQTDVGTTGISVAAHHSSEFLLPRKQTFNIHKFERNHFYSLINSLKYATNSSERRR